MIRKQINLSLCFMEFNIRTTILFPHESFDIIHLEGNITILFSTNLAVELYNNCKFGVCLMLCLILLV
jgi:hypothetical protein